MERSSADHYAVLGVGADASGPEIREAYRARARLLHPDRRGGAADQMAAVNEAYRVLGDPGRRAMYDAARRTPGAGPDRVAPSAPGPSRPAAPSVLPPARVPWRLVAAMFGLGAAAVVILAAMARPAPPATPDNLIGAGSCVVVEPNNDAREVTCSSVEPGVEIRVVRSLVASVPECPNGTDAHRDRQGRGYACLEPVGFPVPDR